MIRREGELTMFNLSIPRPTKQSFARARRRTSSGSGAGAGAGAEHEQNMLRTTAVPTLWSRSSGDDVGGGASSMGGGRRLSDSSNNSDSDGAMPINCDDPLIYRLQHQKRYRKAKRSHKMKRRYTESGAGYNNPDHSRRSGGTNSSSGASSKRDRDPFDLWGSLTSEENSQKQPTKEQNCDDDDDSIDENEGSQVDDFGWSSRGSSSQRRRQQQRRQQQQKQQQERRNSSNLDESMNDASSTRSGLVVDFGVKQNYDRRGRVQSACHLDEMEQRAGVFFMTPKESPGAARHTFSAGLGDGNVNSFLEPQEMQQLQNLMGAYHSHQQPPPTGVYPYQQPPPQPRDLHSEKSSFSSVTNGDYPYNPPSGSGIHSSERSRGSYSSGRASHADLADILSSLERESESMTLLDQRMDQQLEQKLQQTSMLNIDTRPLSPDSSKDNKVNIESCASTLSSPTEKAYQRMSTRLQSSSSRSSSSLPTMPDISIPSSQASLPTCIMSGSAPPSQQHQHDGEQHQQECNNNQIQNNHHYRRHSSDQHQWQQQQQQQQDHGNEQEEDDNCDNNHNQGLAPPPSRRLSESPPAIAVIPFQQPPPQQPPPQQQPPPEEEESPQLTQLKSQTTSELRSELYNMQNLSKANLEKSWAETEKRRVINSDLDDKLDDIKKKLAAARGKLLLSHNNNRRPSSLSATTTSSHNHDRRPSDQDSDGGSRSSSQYYITKLRSSTTKVVGRGFRRRRTIGEVGNITSSVSLFSLGGVSSSGNGGGDSNNDNSISSRILGGLQQRSNSNSASQQQQQERSRSSSIPRSTSYSKFSQRPELLESSSDRLPFRRKKRNNFSSSAIALISENGVRNNNFRASAIALMNENGCVDTLVTTTTTDNSDREGRGMSSSRSLGSGSDFGFKRFEDDSDNDRGNDNGDNDDSDNREFNEQIFNSLLSESSQLGDRVKQMKEVLRNSKSNDDDIYWDDGGGDDDAYASEDSSDAISGVFYPPPPPPFSASASRRNSSGTTTSNNHYSDDDSDAKSGVFYPPPRLDDDDDDDDGDDGADNDNETYCGHQSVGGASLACSLGPPASEMDDFDFDPLNENDSPNQETRLLRRGSGTTNKSAPGGGGGAKRMGGFKRRPSFMGLFDAGLEDDSSNSDDEDLPSLTTSSTPPIQDISNNKLMTGTAVAKRRPNFFSFLSISDAEVLLREKDNEIKQLTKSIQNQEGTIQSNEANLIGAGIESREEGNALKEEEAELHHEVNELERYNSEIESKLDVAEESEQRSQDRVLALQEELACCFNDDENKNNDTRDEDEKKRKLNLERQLSRYQQEYNTAQENAIESLSDILKEFDAVGIPSLREEDKLEEEEDDGISGDIIERFDALTDKEEELVTVLCDADRRSICHSSFRQVQNNIELAMYWKNQLGHLAVDLRSSLADIVILMKKDSDDQGTTTTESSTASERLSLERVFVEAILSQLEMTERNQGKVIHEALSESVEFLTYWDDWLLAAPSPSPRSSSSSSRSLDAIVNTVSKVRAELAEVKLDVLNEQAKFRSKMKSAGIASRPNNARSSNSNNDPNHNDSDQTLTGKTTEVNDGLSEQISKAETLLMERESLINKHASLFQTIQPQRAHQRETPPKPAAANSYNLRLLEEILEEEGDDVNEQQLLNEGEELDKQLSTANTILSERTSLMNQYSSELLSMQGQAQEDSKVHLQLMNEIQVKMKDILCKLAEEEDLIASLESSLREMRERIGELESRRC